MTRTGCPHCGHGPLDYDSLIAEGGIEMARNYYCTECGWQLAVTLTHPKETA